MTETAVPQTTAGATASEAGEAPRDVTAAVHAIADLARTASRKLARANRAWKDRALLEIADSLVTKRDVIIAANDQDMEAGRRNGTSAALLDRLSLDPGGIGHRAAARRNLAARPDPVGPVARGQPLPNGLRLRRVQAPMGVVAAIYEARPNVTVDIAGLALKSGNAVIL